MLERVSVKWIHQSEHCRDLSSSECGTDVVLIRVSGFRPWLTSWFTSQTGNAFRLAKFSYRPPHTVLHVILYTWEIHVDRKRKEILINYGPSTYFNTMLVSRLQRTRKFIKIFLDLRCAPRASAPPAAATGICTTQWVRLKVLLKQNRYRARKLGQPVCKVHKKSSWIFMDHGT